MENQHIDLDIGTPKKETINVDVQNFIEVISKMELQLSELNEAVAELKKIRAGAGYILGQSIDEVEE